jgi:bud site selection protein 20
MIRVKQLKEEPYSQKEAEAAAGLATDNGKTQDQEAGFQEMEMG